MRRIGWLVALTFLSSCGAGPVPDMEPASSNEVSLKPQDWFVLYSPGMPDHPSSAPRSGEAWLLQFPDPPHSIHYVQTPFHATVPLSHITMTFRIDSSANVSYNGKVDPLAWDPATFHVFIQRRGDNLQKDFYRWWASDGGHILGSHDNSVVTIVVPLDYRRWTSVFGHVDEQEFQNTLRDLGWVGFTFGGSNFFGHGVNLNAGRATFTLIDYRVD